MVVSLGLYYRKITDGRWSLKRVKYQKQRDLFLKAIPVGLGREMEKTSRTAVLLGREGGRHYRDQGKMDGLNVEGKGESRTNDGIIHDKGKMRINTLSKRIQ